MSDIPEVLKHTDYFDIFIQNQVPFILTPFTPITKLLHSLLTDVSLQS